MRLIDADALIEKLKQHHDFSVNAWGGFRGMPIQDKARCDELSNSIAEIINAPTIEAPTWIPCSERLPEERGIYLCTVEAPYRNPREMYYAPQEWADKSDNATWRSTDGNYVFDWFVEAWQPLPEPWKGADDERL